MTEEPQRFVPPTMMGVVYWKDHVLGVIDDHGQAQAAVDALIAAGWSADDAKAWTGEFVTENHQYYLQHRSVLQRLGALVSSEEGDVMDDYVREAGERHSVVTVRAAEDATARRAADLLGQHGAHHLVHYRANTLVTL